MRRTFRVLSPNFLRGAQSLAVVWGVFAGIEVMCVPQLRADVRISEVEIDNQAIPLNKGTSGDVDEQRPIQVSDSSRSLIFHFTETNDLGVPTARLRYKLEGYDSEWHDLHPDPEMRVSIQFSDANNLIVGTCTFDLLGQTPGWKSKVEDSDFHLRKETATVPARSVHARFLLYSHGGNSGVGVVALDGLRVSVQHPKNPVPEVYDWSISAGNDLDQPLGTPSNWRREGPRAEMAQLRIRKTPTPHPILIIYDDDPTRSGVWATAREQGMKVREGDRLTLTWETAHSVGSGGPGQAAYRNLKPGRYWFRVATASTTGEPTGNEVSLPLEVVVPFFRRSEFLIVVVAILGGSATALTRVLMRRRMQNRIDEIERLHELERERVRIARDLHDDIGGGLTEIAMQSDWVRRDIIQGITADTLRRIERVSKSAAELTRSVDEIVWAVNPVNDTLDRFATYLSQSTEQFLDATDIRVRFDFPSELPPWNLPGKVRHGLFMAIREALHNAAKHSGADLIRLTLQLTGRELLIVVEDNGCGFTAEQEKPDGVHDGLENMHRRMQEIGGVLTLKSQSDKGSRLEFRLILEETQELI